MSTIKDTQKDGTDDAPIQVHREVMREEFGGVREVYGPGGM